MADTRARTDLTDYVFRHDVVAIHNIENYYMQKQSCSVIFPNMSSSGPFWVGLVDPENQ